jgi:hypothetical protein
LGGFFFIFSDGVLATFILFCCDVILFENDVPLQSSILVNHQEMAVKDESSSKGFDVGSQAWSNTRIITLLDDVVAIGWNECVVTPGIIQGRSFPTVTGGNVGNERVAVALAMYRRHVRDTVRSKTIKWNDGRVCVHAVTLKDMESAKVSSRDARYSKEREMSSLCVNLWLITIADKEWVHLGRTIMLTRDEVRYKDFCIFVLSFTICIVLHGVIIDDNKIDDEFKFFCICD